MKRYDTVAFIVDYPVEILFKNCTLLEALIDVSILIHSRIWGLRISWANEYSASITIRFDKNHSFLNDEYPSKDLRDLIPILYSQLLKCMLKEAFDENENYFYYAVLWHETEQKRVDAIQTDNELQQSQQWFFDIFEPVFKRFGLEGIN